MCVEWMQGVQATPWVILTLHNQKSSRTPVLSFDMDLEVGHESQADHEAKVFDRLIGLFFESTFR